MPSLDHEAPLEVLRTDPALVATLLREVLGIELPQFGSAEEASADLTQPLPAEFRADLVVYLRSKPPERAPIMGIVVEVQRGRNINKRRSWPLYVAALHARLEIRTCLLVLASDESIARWSATPIMTLQPGSPFTPVVISLEQVPLVRRERASEEPLLAVLSALAHGNRPGGVDVARAAIDALASLDEERATFFYELICACLSGEARRALEDDMDQSRYKPKSPHLEKLLEERMLEIARERAFEEGSLLAVRKVLISIATAKLGDLDPGLRARVEESTDIKSLEGVVIEISSTSDPAVVATILGKL